MESFASRLCSELYSFAPMCAGIMLAATIIMRNIVSSYKYDLENDIREWRNSNFHEIAESAKRRGSGSKENRDIAARAKINSVFGKRIARLKQYQKIMRIVELIFEVVIVVEVLLWITNMIFGAVVKYTH